MNANESFDPADFRATDEPIAPITQKVTLPNIAGRYQTDRILGINATGGRVTYLAHRITPSASTAIQDASASPQTDSIDLDSAKVVIKEFQFAQTGSSWQGYDAIAREFEILQAIDHPGIPRYIEHIETDRAIYLVQAYKDAPSLAQRIANPAATSDLSTVYQAAIDLLKILVYLQSCTPPIVHRDLKPENVLYSEAGEIALVDFGFARRGISGDSDGTASSLVRGTMGFMAPEQILNRPLTTATDLYGLGATLVCWLTGTPSDRIGDWIGEGFRLEVDRALPQLSSSARRWFANLVAPEVGDRFGSARSALMALQAISFETDETNQDAAVQSTVSAKPCGSKSLTLSGFKAQHFAELQRSFPNLPLRRLMVLAIASGGFIWGLELWWSLSLAAGRAIEMAIRSLLSI
jgi:serine/threonine protein kinase